MALVVFGEKIDFTTITLPEQGGYVVGYDINTELLSQMDYLGNVSIIGSIGSGAPLSNTLLLGNSTGTHSISLDSYIENGTNRISLDNGVVSLSTDNGSYAESYLYLNSTNAILGNVNKSFRIESTGIYIKWSESDKQIINTNSYELLLNNLNTLQFGKTASGAGNKLSTLISTDNSYITNGLNNTVVIGGQNINATQSNSVYVPFLYIQDGKFIKGTKGTGKIIFSETGDVISSNTKGVIGLVSSTSSTIFTQNGILLKDSTTSTSSPNYDTGITYISSRNSGATSSIKNSVIIGGQNLYATQDNTVYLSSLNINNQYTLPTTDGSIGQVFKTDGSGNLTWEDSSVNLITLNYTTFLSLAGTFSSDTTYVITDANELLYGGTEIYLTTNSLGVLNEYGIGKFYNPIYNQSISGFGIFSTSSSYITGDNVIWGGYVWESINGITGTQSDLFTLDITKWDKKEFDEVYYSISYDRIIYDWENNLIIYRNEKNTNIVSTNKSNIDNFEDILDSSPIKVFQWGNVYNIISDKGIGSQNIINSYNENINFKGISQFNINMNNNSAQYNLVVGASYSQKNITFDNYFYNRQSILINTLEDGLVFQGNLPNTNTSKLMGKFNNQQVEIDLTHTSLVTPIISSRWDIYNNDGTTPFGPTSISDNIIGSFSTSNSIIVPVGCKVSFIGTSSIPMETIGLSNPTTRSGSFTFSGTTYPVVSATLSATNISSDITYTTTITKPKSGLILSGSQIISATGSDTLSVNAEIEFSYLFYYGHLAIGLTGVTITQGYVDGVTSSQIEGLGNYRFGGKEQTFISSNGLTGSRLTFAYPSLLGDVNTLNYVGSVINSIGAFTKRTNTVTVQTIAGNSLEYLVYVANSDSTWNNDEITIT